jgi:hypothetical protein
MAWSFVNSALCKDSEKLGLRWVLRWGDALEGALGDGMRWERCNISAA